MKISKKYYWILVVLAIPTLLIGVILYPILFKQFKGEVEEISFSSDITLNGVLIKPNGPGPYPAIVLLHGAGSSHQKYDKPYFKYHANAFLKKGFAVLVYTKRGSGTSSFDYKYFTYEKLLSDAEASIDFLNTQNDIDHDNIGVMGVSESGWFTPELAYRNPNIRFIINRVSSPFNIIHTVSHEIEMDALAEGFTKKEIDDVILPFSKEIWQYYIDVYKDSTLVNSSQRKAINDKLGQLNKHERFGKWFTFNELEPYNSLSYEASAKRFLYDPMPYFNKLTIPMFYVLAGKDKNIPTKKVVEFLDNIKSKEKKDVEIKVYPEASHYLYKYGLEDGPFDGLLYYDDYLESLSDWAKKQLK